MKFERYSALTGELLEVLSYSYENEIEESLKALNQSFSIWKNVKTEDRQKCLKTVLARLEHKKDFLAQLITEEMAKPIKQSQVEVQKCIQTIKYLTEMNLDFLIESEISSIYKKSKIKHEPLGIIYAIQPWNFPLWQVVRAVIPNLLVGNVILLKHSEVTPRMGDEIQKLFDNVFETPILIHKMISHQMTDQIMADARVAGLSLTGSSVAGQSVALSAAKSFKKVVLELGGSDPYLVLEDADLAKAAKVITQSRLSNSGQVCISAKRCLVSAKIKDNFIDLLKQEFQSYQFGDPKELATDIGPLAQPRFKNNLEKQIEDFQKYTSAEKIFEKSHGQNQQSAFANSQIYYLSENNMWLKNQEFFAPVLIVLPFSSDKQAVEVANSTDFALGAGIWSADLVRAQAIANNITAGQIAINDFVKSDATLPFGGFKKSGFGREMGREGFFEFTQAKVVSYS